MDEFDFILEDRDREEEAAEYRAFKKTAAVFFAIVATTIAGLATAYGLIGDGNKEATAQLNEILGFNVPDSLETSESMELLQLKINEKLRGLNEEQQKEFMERLTAFAEATTSKKYKKLASGALEGAGVPAGKQTFVKRVEPTTTEQGR